MPKVGPDDHRPARAVLHAPYPLPFIVTRQPAPSAPPPSLPRPSPGPLPLIAAPASLTDFPSFTSDWRERSPAYTPVPYPIDESQAGREEVRRKRIIRLQLLRMRRREAESSEWEMMSGSGDPGPGGEVSTSHQEGNELLSVTKQVGMISSGEGGKDEEDPNMDEDNLLIYAFVSSFERGDFDSSPSEHSPQTPTETHPLPIAEAEAPAPHSDNDPTSGGANFDTPAPWGDGSESDNHSTPKQLPKSLLSRTEPIKPNTPAWDVVSDATSSFWSEGTDADQADEEDQETPASHNLVTPSASTSRIAKRTKHRNASQATREGDKPLFLGQTNQSPFTYVPPPRRPASQSSIGESTAFAGGYASEVGSVRTVRQIPRSRVNRMRVARDKGKQREILRERSITPTQRDYLPAHRNAIQPGKQHGPWRVKQQQQSPFTTTGQSYTSALPTQLTTLPTAIPAPPQQSMMGLETFAFAPIAPLMRTSEVLSSPPISGSGPTVQAPGPARMRAPSWSPQPMSIDPRTAEGLKSGGRVSWPHPLPAREQVPPSNSSSLLQRIAGASSDTDVPMPTAQSRIAQPPQPAPAPIRKPHMTVKEYRRKRAQAAHAKARGADLGIEMRQGMVPLGKACHNALLLRKLRADKASHRTADMEVDVKPDLERFEGAEQYDRRRHPRVRALMEEELGNVRIAQPQTPYQNAPMSASGQQQAWNNSSQWGTGTNFPPTPHTGEYNSPPQWVNSGASYSSPMQPSPPQGMRQLDNQTRQPAPFFMRTNDGMAPGMTAQYSGDRIMGFKPEAQDGQGWGQRLQVHGGNTAMGSGTGMGMGMSEFDGGPKLTSNWSMNRNQTMISHYSKDNFVNGSHSEYANNSIVPDGYLIGNRRGGNYDDGNQVHRGYNGHTQVNDLSSFEPQQTMQQQQQRPQLFAQQAPSIYLDNTFPTPGPSPQAHQPQSRYQSPYQTQWQPQGNGYPGWTAVTPQSPDVEDIKPPRKRRRSISPSSAHFMQRLFAAQGSPSHPHQRPTPAPTPGRPTHRPRGEVDKHKRSEVQTRPPPTPSRGLIRERQRDAEQGRGLLPPAQIRNSFSPTHEDVSVSASDSEDSKMYERAIYDLGLDPEDEWHEDEETDTEREERRERWLDQQVKIHLRAERAKSLGPGARLQGSAPTSRRGGGGYGDGSGKGKGKGRA